MIHPLELSTILDSGTTLHIFNDLSQFTNFRKAPSHHILTAGDHEVLILGYGDVHVNVTRPNGGIGTLRLKNAAFCTDFATNLVLFRLLREKGYYWNNKGWNNYLARHDDTVICTMEEIYRQQVLEYVPYRSSNTVTVANRSREAVRKPKRTSRHPKPPSKSDAKLWHLQMGHPGPLSLHHLGRNTIRARLQGPKTTECQHCAQAKIKRQISRAAPNRTISKPLTEIHIDWTNLAEAYAGYVRVTFITDVYSGRTFPYFMMSHGEETDPSGP
jgi:hypothetical protein